ncbi:MAG: VTT domain-containing protein [Planctomycetaceae bacterium]|nr:VTT domain-containing protein [Planctomycetaceae bacterium]
MPGYLRVLLILVAVLAVPCVPFLLLGDAFEQSVAAWATQFTSPVALFWSVVTVLSVDILLPVPSSAVSTFAGAKLGVIAATAASMLGMTIGACLGFLLSRWAGPSLLPWLAKSEDVDRLRQFQHRWSLWLLLITRPLPILAEACVVLLGSLRMPWNQFLPIVLLSHFVIALLYALLGAWAATAQATTWALLGSVVIPLLLTVIVRASLSTSRDENVSDQS